MKENYIKTISLDAISAIQTTPKIIADRTKTFFPIKKYDPVFKREYRSKIKDFVVSLKEIFGDLPIDVPHVSGGKAITWSLEKVLLRTWLTDTLLFYLFDKHKEAFLLKAGFSVKPIPSRIDCDSGIVKELKREGRVIYREGFTPFDAELFCPIFYRFYKPPDITLVGFLAVGKNLYGQCNPDIWSFISARLSIRLMRVVTYIKLEATKQLKEHFESLGYSAEKINDCVKFEESSIENIDAYRNIKLDLKNLVALLYGFKEAWQIFELFSGRSK